ncbi:hypothetical protein, variant [Aphanomyces astaci]|uniref:C5orf34-like C-terminal domain-containing protein n=1 Tax=Aphanomyces astaci TaxID=112090 RepID=W4FRH7_APHAT|nr:hypothetical protein, variant [Aphanomyces astaci]ETV69268.1 hypothetical protein, variant [Aphanomyces astaci]|eukprot:XP_009841125.1 hypothetical protein, variant [Aphanomyces astaci]
MCQPTCMLLLADGSTIGGFHIASDSCSSKQHTNSPIRLTACVVLEPDGHCYSYLSSETLSTSLTVQRFTCASAPSAHIPLLRPVLAFRNKYSLDRPLYLHQHHLLASTLQWQVGHPCRPQGAISARWRCGTFHISRMECADGLRLQSLDGMASVTYMTQSTHFFHASFLAPVEYHGSDQHLAGRGLFTRVEQCFTRHNVPKAFAYSAQVLQHAAAAISDGRQSFAYHGGEEEPSSTNVSSCQLPGSYVVTHLPTNMAFTSRPNWTMFRPSASSTCIMSPSDVFSLCRRYPSNQASAVVATSSTLLSGLCRVEWTRTATFMAFPSQLVCVHVHVDDSAIECTRSGFFHHRRGAQDHCYTVDAIPSHPPFHPQPNVTLFYDVTDICLRAKRRCDVLTEASPADNPDAPLLLAPHQVVEEQHTPMGLFRAFGDGRVRVLFRDRAILSMDPQAKFCSLLLPSGDSITLLATAPSPQHARYRKVRY